MPADSIQTPPVVRAGIYTRISWDPEGQRAGVERQRVDCEALCTARSGAGRLPRRIEVSKAGLTFVARSRSVLVPWESLKKVSSAWLSRESLRWVWGGAEAFIPGVHTARSYSSSSHWCESEPPPSRRRGR